VIGQSWFANGKFLITGEYLVLEGAKALALPLKPGQYLSVKEVKDQHLLWTAMTQKGLWFQVKFSIPQLKIVSSTNESLGKKLKQILLEVKKLNPQFLSAKQGFEVETILEFDPEHGLGSSSTLIANIARWSEVDPYRLLKPTFGGSGYDVACATSRSPVLYQLVDDKPKVENIIFNPVFSENIFFVYLGNKKKSSDGIRSFKKNSTFNATDVQKISKITERIVNSKFLEEFEELLTEHELIMSEILHIPTVKSLHFPDIKGAVKSMGAWGGDFVLLTSLLKKEELKNCLSEKGFDTVYSFDEVVFVEP